MNAQSVNDRYPMIVAATALALLALMVLLLAGAPVYTEDLWWHLKAGEMYATEGPWPEADWMLHTAREEAPIQHEWLFGVAMYWVERMLGFQGLRAVQVAAVSLTAWLAFSLFRRAGDWTVGACFAACVFLTLAWFRLFQLRPDLFSIVATLAGFRLLLESGAAPSARRLAAYALLIAVWVNVHSLFLVSLNLLVAALLGLALGGFMELRIPASDEGKRRRIGTRRSLARRLAAALGIGLLVALLNPRGIEQHLTFFASTQATAIWHVTDEWSHFHPFDFAANHDSVTLAMWLAADLVMLGFLAAACVAAGRFLRSPGPGTLAAFGPVGFGLGLAAIVAMLVSIRFLWMCVFPLVYLLRAHGWMIRGHRRVVHGAAWTLALASALMAASFSVSYGFANLVARFGYAPGEYVSMPFRTHKFHVEGVRFLSETGLEGKLFNAYGMGGFLGYWLAPRLRTFVDSRAEHYDSEVYMDYSAVTEMLGRRPGETFLDVLDRRDVDIFFGIGFPGWWHTIYTTTHLDRVPGWLLVSRSFRHAIYLRLSGANRQNLDRIAAWYEAQDVPFDRERGLDPSAVIRARPDWAKRRLMLPPDYDDLLADAESADPATRLRARSAVALVYLLTGAYELQIEWDRRTARAFPQDRRSRQRLVYALLRNGALEEAALVADQLMAIDPRDRWSRDLLALVKEYRRLGSAAVTAFAGEDLQVHRNHLLWRKLPATAAETWAVELAMPTESLEPLPAER